MDLDKGFVSSLIREGKEAYTKALSKGVKPEFLFDDGRKAFDFIKEYFEKYGELPSPSAIEGTLGVSVDATTDSAEFFAEQIVKRRLHNRLRDGLTAVVALIESRKPEEAFSENEKLLNDIREEKTVVSSVESLLALGPDVIALYEKIKNGERGVLTPWESVNEITFGFWPEDLVLFAARLAIGKTFAMTLLAHHAWKSGKKVLFGTTEMSKIKMAMRFYAIDCKLPYGELTHGRLSSFGEKKLAEEVQKKMKQEGMYVIGGDFDFSSEAFEESIKTCKPDVAILDGAYLMQSRKASKDRFEAAASSFNELKRIAKRRHIPVVVTQQFNRDVKVSKKHTVKVENIAMTDVAGWNGDLIFGMIQTEDMKRDGRMTLRCLKAREGAISKDIDLYWNLATMNFDEINAPKKEDKGKKDKDDDPYGTGVPEVSAQTEFDVGDVKDDVLF